MKLKTSVDVSQALMDRQHQPTLHSYRILSEFIQKFLCYRVYRQNDM